MFEQPGIGLVVSAAEHAFVVAKLEEKTSKLYGDLAAQAARLRALTEAGCYLRDSLDAQVNRRTRAYDPDADRVAIARWDAARSADLPHPDTKGGTQT